MIYVPTILGVEVHLTLMEYEELTRPLTLWQRIKAVFKPTGNLDQDED